MIKVQHFQPHENFNQDGIPHFERIQWKKVNEPLLIPVEEEQQLIKEFKEFEENDKRNIDKETESKNEIETRKEKIKLANQTIGQTNPYQLKVINLCEC